MNLKLVVTGNYTLTMETFCRASSRTEDAKAGEGGSRRMEAIIKGILKIM
jgi:hypothetical protein